MYIPRFVFRFVSSSPSAVFFSKMSLRILKSVGYGVALGLIVAGFLSDLLLVRVIGILTLVLFVFGFFYYRKKFTDTADADYRVFFKGLLPEPIVAPTVEFLLSDSNIRARSISALRLLEDEKISDLKSFFIERVPGQSSVVSGVVSAIRAKERDFRPKTPFLSFLFVGPVGVGKVDAARAISEFYFGSDEFLIRFDMTQFSRADGAIKLFGSTDNSHRGALSRAISSKSRYVLLCDNFDVAHQDVKSMFVKILRDSKPPLISGVSASFSNAIFIFTFNILSPQSIVSSNASPEDFENAILSRLAASFSHEFISDVSHVSVFHHFRPNDVVLATHSNLSRLSNVLSKTQNISIIFEASAVQAAAKLGYDSTFGLRPLKDVISARIRNKIAERILDGTIKKGSRVRIGFFENDFTFYV